MAFFILKKALLVPSWVHTEAHLFVGPGGMRKIIESPCKYKKRKDKQWAKQINLTEQDVALRSMSILTRSKNDKNAQNISLTLVLVVFPQ